MVNEVLQWGAVLIIGTFVFGLMRQLSVFISTPAEQRAGHFGPALDTTVPEELMGTAEMTRLRGETQRAIALIAVNEQCDACHDWIDALASETAPPVVYITSSRDPDYLEVLGGTDGRPGVLSDPDGVWMGELNLRTTPMLMVIGRNGRVTYKQLSGDVFDGMSRVGFTSSDPVQVLDHGAVTS